MRVSKMVDTMATVAMVLGVLLYWAVLAGLLWLIAIEPIRRSVMDLLPAGARQAAGIGFAVVGGLLLIIVVIVGILGMGESGRRSHPSRTPDQAGGYGTAAGEVDYTGL
jgi:hypothetical protein